jgi:hypothetical protein
VTECRGNFGGAARTDDALRAPFLAEDLLEVDFRVAVRPRGPVEDRDVRRAGPDALVGRSGMSDWPCVPELSRFSPLSVPDASAVLTVPPFQEQD